MNFLFIDDTEQIRKRYVGIGGVIFHDERIDNLFSMFRSIKSLHGIPSDEEIKWSPRRDSWIYRNLVGDKRTAAYSDILNLVGMFSGKAMVAVTLRDMTSFDVIEAKWKCIEFITERFQFFCQAQEDKNGIIIADFPSSKKDEKELLKDYYRLLDEGTSYVKPTNVIMNLLTTESHLNPGLQLADLVTGVTTALCTKHRDYALPFWSTIKGKLYRSIYGSVKGCGLKIFPTETAEEVYRILFPRRV